MNKKTLKALRAFQENISEEQYEYDKGEEYISSQDLDDEADLLDALIQANNTLKLCPQTSAVVMTLLLIEEVLDKYDEV